MLPISISWPGPLTTAVDGWVFTAIAIAIAAAEVAIGLAILLSLYSTQETISLDEANILKN